MPQRVRKPEEIVTRMRKQASGPLSKKFAKELEITVKGLRREGLSDAKIRAHIKKYLPYYTTMAKDDRALKK